MTPTHEVKEKAFSIPSRFTVILIVAAVSSVSVHAASEGSEPYGEGAILGGTLLGGSSTDASWPRTRVAIGADGSIYVAGDTSSPDFPSPSRVRLMKAEAMSSWPDSAPTRRNSSPARLSAGLETITAPLLPSPPTERSTSPDRQDPMTSQRLRMRLPTRSLAERPGSSFG